MYCQWLTNDTAELIYDLLPAILHSWPTNQSKAGLADVTP